jgi:hypothetical protein
LPPVEILTAIVLSIAGGFNFDERSRKASNVRAEQVEHSRPLDVGYGTVDVRDLQVVSGRGVRQLPRESRSEQEVPAGDRLFLILTPGSLQTRLSPALHPEVGHYKSEMPPVRTAVDDIQKVNHSLLFFASNAGFAHWDRKVPIAVSTPFCVFGLPELHQKVQFMFPFPQSAAINERDAESV